MKRTILSTALFFLCMTVARTNASENNGKTIHLICKYSYTINEKGEKSGTSGEELFIIQSLQKGQVVVHKQGLSPAPFLGRMSEEEIVADVGYEINNVKLAESLIINRFTGSFQISFGAPGKSGLIHFGNCHPAKKQLF